jgi:hypothetical protein
MKSRCRSRRASRAAAVSVFAIALAALAVARAASGAAPGTAPLRPADLLATPAQYVGHTVELLIVEPTSGATNATELARAEYGQIEVRVPEMPPGTLVLVPPAWQAGDAARYRRKFDRVLVSPLRVRGEVLADEEMSREMHRPYLVVRVAAAEPLPEPLPAVVPSLADLAARSAHWDRRYVVYQGTYRSGFEVSSLDGDIWLEIAPGATVLGDLGGAAHGGGLRVRATGYLFAKAGAHYGHLGAYHSELLATQLEVVGAPVAPGKKPDGR